MPIDASIPLGFKQPDAMQSLSGLLNVAKSQQELQNNAMTLNERKAIGQFMSDPANITDDKGNLDIGKLQAGISRYAPTTGYKYGQAAVDFHKAHTEAQRAANSLTAENKGQIGQTMYATLQDPKMPLDVVDKTFDALGDQLKGGKPLTDYYKTIHQHIYNEQGPDAALQFRKQLAESTQTPATQRTLNTPTVTQVDNGQQVEGYNMAPNVSGMPQGSRVLSVQKQLPPNTPTVGPNNQPGYVGTQGPAATQPTPAQVQPSVRAAFNKEAGAAFPNNNIGPDTARTMQQELAAEQAKGPNANPQMIAGLQREIARAQQAVGGQGGFVPSGPVPGANESKAASVQVNNDHWANLNKQAENSQTLESVIQNIKALAPKAITGTLAGRTSFVNGLLNSMHLGDKITGDLQKDTDLLEKNMAQLNLGTPAATDAVRTIVGAARPHGTMQQGAIEEASDQLLGQIRANRAVRNALTVPKQIQDQTGDPGVYQTTKAHMEELADPRIFQYESLPKGKARTDFLAKQKDATKLVEKTDALVKMGVFQ